jgi:plasmid stabilization system protein ParE
MRDVRWSREAEHDLWACVSWLVRRSDRSAHRFGQAVSTAVDRIAANPFVGRQDLSDPDRRIKSLPDWHKVIFYRIEGNTIEIEAIRDTRMDPKGR